MNLGKPARAVRCRLGEDPGRQQSREVGKQKVSEFVVTGSGGRDLYFFQRIGVPRFRD